MTYRSEVVRHVRAGHEVRAHTRGQPWVERRREDQKRWAYAWRVRQHYGIDVEDVARFFEHQGGRCPVCARPLNTSFHIDHDHVTGLTRGLLHGVCNYRRLPFIEQRADTVLCYAAITPVDVYIYSKIIE